MTWRFGSPLEMAGVEFIDENGGRAGDMTPHTAYCCTTA
jgi:hypothetical protein